MIKYIDSLSAEELKDKKVLLRVDFNVPIQEDGITIADDFRIRATKPTIDFLLAVGAKIQLVSHITSVASFEPLLPQISKILEREIVFDPDLSSSEVSLEKYPLTLLENIRKWPEEEKNDSAFGGSLTCDFDIYVNDAFSVSHRAHASVASDQLLPVAYGGLLMKQELTHLSEVLKAPAKGKVVILGGAKIGTKLPVIKNFLDKAEYILVGGALAHSFFKARGMNIGKSLVDEDFAIVKDLLHDTRIVLPQDFVTGHEAKAGTVIKTYESVTDIAEDEMILDIGPKTSRHFSEIISNANLVVWNGPMGFSEVSEFAHGTQVISNAVAHAKESLIGGGDTIAAVKELLPQFSYVSGGGGAMLVFLAGERMPGLEALDYYEL